MKRKQPFARGPSSVGWGADTGTRYFMQPILEKDPNLSFYYTVLRRLTDSRIPFLVGGSFAMGHYMDLSRHAKDLDLFVARRDVDAIFQSLAHAGYRTELSFSHWLAKVYNGADFIDIVFNSGNGICKVDESWFDRALPGEICGLPVKICAPEELIWSKAFIMERERYDGADLTHLVRAYHPSMDWEHLLGRFGPHWHLLLSHLILFLFIYPSERAAIPEWLMRDLFCRMRAEAKEVSPERVCNGTLLSRTQYRMDIEEWAYKDARLKPVGNMTEQEAALWTAASETH
ncbi:MAG: nucleotidyltransferase [Candidatus Binatia bacterium]